MKTTIVNGFTVPADYHEAIKGFHKHGDALKRKHFDLVKSVNTELESTLKEYFQKVHSYDITKFTKQVQSVNNFKFKIDLVKRIVWDKSMRENYYFGDEFICEANYREGKVYVGEWI